MLAPPVFEDDEEKTRAVRLLNAVLWALLVMILLIGPVLIVFDTTSGRLLTAAVSLVVILVDAGLIRLMHRGHVRPASGGIATLLLVVVTFSLYGWSGIRSPAVAGYVIVILLAGLLLGGWGISVFVTLSLLSAIGVFLVELNGGILLPIEAEPDFGAPIIFATVLGVAAVLVAFALRDVTDALKRAHENEHMLAESLQDLQTSRAELEARTRDLERRSVQLQTAAEIARDATTARDLGDLLSRTTNLIQSRFDYYYVGIFLVEEVDIGSERARAQDLYAVLHAATGEAGQQLLEQSYRLRVGGISMVGIVTATGQPRIAQDISSDAMRYENPLLPETRSEVALPLQVGGRVIGALDVQSREPAAFDSDEVTILQTMADQLAVAIQNTRLLGQMRQTVRELEMASGRYTRESWRETIEGAERTLGYRYLKSGVEPIAGRPSLGDVLEDRYTATVPIRFRDAVIGTFTLRSTGDAIPEEARLLVQGVAERLTLALENARLLEETRQRAAWEQTLSEMTARFTRSLDTDTLLRTAVRELGQLLQMDEIAIHIGAPGAPVQVDEPS